MVWNTTRPMFGINRLNGLSALAYFRDTFPGALPRAEMDRTFGPEPQCKNGKIRNCAELVADRNCTAGQIRETLIHGHYPSQKDIEICLACDPTPVMKRHDDANAMTAIKALHDQFQAQYREEELTPA